MVEAVHVGEPTLDDPKRTYAPDITKENVAYLYRGRQCRQTCRSRCRGYAHRRQ